MDQDQLTLRIGKDLQLVIAAAQDLHSTLQPHRSLRLKRKTRLAAGLGGATTAVVGGAMWAANIGFWASLGAALGLGSIPLIVTLAGTGGLALGLPQRHGDDASAYARQRDQLELTYWCFMLLAEADGRISEEEQLILRSVLLQIPLTDEDRQAIQSASPEEVLGRAPGLPVAVRRQVMQGTWMLAETDGVSEEEEELYRELARRLDLGDETLALKKESHTLQAGLNDLVTAMFRSCQQVLAPALGSPRANTFLEALAQIAATPPARRSLRNSLTSGFSAGGAGRLLHEHGEAPKLVAQAHNGVRAVHGTSAEGLKDGRRRLLELADSTVVGARLARTICADVDLLFDQALEGASAEPDE